MSFIVVVPLRRARRIEVFTTTPDDLWDLYTVIQDNTPDAWRVTIAHCGEDQLGAWLANNVEPVWYEKVIGRIRFALNTMTRPA